MTGPQKISKLSVEEYLAFEEDAECKHEYVNGTLFAMTGASRKHITITLNIAASLRNSLKGSGCDVFMVDMKVHAVAANSFYYPDVVVECKSAEKHEFFSDAPSVIFEVLSKSTATTDRREKLVAYQMIDSLQSYVIVHQSRKRIEHHQKVGEDWEMQEMSSRGELIFKCGSDEKPAIKLTLDEIYEGVQVDEGPDLQVREDVEAYAW